MESIRFRFKTKITMEPVTACDLLISYLEKSNLNLQLVETPFEAQIEIRKTFIEDKAGISRTSDLTHYTSSELFEEEKKPFVANQEALVKENESLQNQLFCCQNNLVSLEIDIKQLNISQTILEKNKGDLTHALEEKKSEIDLLEKSLKNKEAINNATKDKLDQSKRTLKAKEKENIKIQVGPTPESNFILKCILVPKRI